MSRKTIKSLEAALDTVRQLRDGERRSMQALQDERNELKRLNEAGSRRLSDANAEIRFLREVVSSFAGLLRKAGA